MKRIALVVIAAATLAVGLAACTKSSGKRYPAIPFPPGFLWGTATAAYQVEGGNTQCDWYGWEQIAGKIKNGDRAGLACDEYHLYDQDFALAQSLGQNAHRFSIEWSRIEPTLGAAYDTAEIAHYHSVISSARAHGLRPIVTLEHYTLPLWADNPLGATVTGTAGWACQATQDEFVKFAGAMAAEYGHDVDDWIVFNEPMVAAVGAWQGIFPPDVGGSLPKTIAMAEGMVHANARAYDAIKAADVWTATSGGTPARVGIAQAIVNFGPKDPTNAADVAAATHLDYVFNQWFLNALTKGDLDVDLDGAYTSPGDVTSDPSLAHRLDFIGVNYYRRYVVLAGAPEPIEGLPIDDPTLPHMDNGESIYPEGMYQALLEAGSYGLPVIVSENGIADAADKQRPSYLVNHLYEVHRAIAAGVPVYGYLQWSLMDNFEWAEGFGSRFGELHTDFATEARQPLTSTGVYEEISKANALTAHVQDKYRSVP